MDMIRTTCAQQFTICNNSLQIRHMHNVFFICLFINCKKELVTKPLNVSKWNVVDCKQYTNIIFVQQMLDDPYMVSE